MGEIDTWTCSDNRLSEVLWICYIDRQQNSGACLIPRSVSLTHNSNVALGSSELLFRNGCKFMVFWGEWIVLHCLLVSRRPWVEGSVLSSFSNWSDQRCTSFIYDDQFFVLTSRLYVWSFLLWAIMLQNLAVWLLYKSFPLHQIFSKYMKWWRA